MHSDFEVGERVRLKEFIGVGATKVHLWEHWTNYWARKSRDLCEDKLVYITKKSVNRDGVTRYEYHVDAAQQGPQITADAFTKMEKPMTKKYVCKLSPNGVQYTVIYEDDKGALLEYQKRKDCPKFREWYSRTVIDREMMELK